MVDRSHRSLSPGRFVRSPAALAVVLILALAVRLPGLASFGYGVDEGKTAAEAIRLVDVYDWQSWEIPTRKLHPLSGSIPLSYYLAAAGLETVGRDFVGLRLPFLVLGLASIALTWLVARRLLGAPVVAVLAALYLALNPAHVAYSQFARFYIPALTLGLLWALALHHVVRRPDALAGLALAAVLALGYLTHHLFPLLLPIGMAYVALALRHPPLAVPSGYRPRLVIVVALAVLVSSLPLVANVPEMLGKGEAASMQQSRTLAWGLRNVVRAGGGAMLRVEPALLLLGAVGAWIAVRRFRREGLLLALLGFALAAETLSMGLLGQIRGRYVIWCIPYFAILAALATLRDSSGRPRRSALATPVALLVIATLGHGLVGYQTHGGGRVAAARIRDEAREFAGTSRVVILGNGPPAEAMRLAGWDVDRLLRIPTPAIPRAHLEIAPFLDERLVLVVHQQTEPLLEKSALWGDSRLRLLQKFPDRTRRQELYYAVYEWQP